MENVGVWTGSVGNIYKGTTTATGQSVTIDWTGDKYLYIVYNSSLSNLTAINIGAINVLGTGGTFTNPPSTVGNYKVYRSVFLQAGGAGTSITFNLT